MKVLISLAVSIIGIAIFQGCIQRNDFNNEPIVVDFSEKKDNNSMKMPIDSNQVLKIAVSAIVSPRESFVYYEELFSYISKEINTPFKIIQRKTYQEVNLMLRNQQVDLAFICSGAYVVENEKSGIEILVVPVCNGKPYYQAYFITNRLTGINQFEDYQGKSFAFTDPLSNSGKLYADKRLNEIGTTADLFFSKTMFTYAHDISIQLVSKNVVHGATIDGLIYNYLADKTPERVKNIKIIEKSEDFGIPPIVVPKNLNKKLRNKLKDIFLTLHEDSIGREILNKLLINKFIEGQDSNYNSIRELKMLTKK